MVDVSPLSVQNLEVVKRLTRDQAMASKTLGEAEVRFVVDTYYAIQKMRVGQNNRSKMLDKQDEPHAVVDWIRNQQEILENQVKRALERWSHERPIGRWTSSIYGIGPILTAGLIAHTDITRCPSVSNLWSFAGVNPAQKWQKGVKRPWNAALKTLVWKIGESFVKMANREDDFYGKFYRARKTYEWQRNLDGGNAEVALERIRSGVRLGGTQKLWYEGCITPEVALEFQRIRQDNAGNPARAQALSEKYLQENQVKPGSGTPMLPPGHIQARASRYAAKLFLSHYHEVYYWLTFGVRPALPYVITHLSHADYIPPPNTHVVTDLDWSTIPIIVPNWAGKPN